MELGTNGGGKNLRTEFGELGQPARISIEMLRVADSPRLDGVNMDHVQRLASIDATLPAIIVHRCSMSVIDGVHRLEAAKLRGDNSILAVFFDGPDTDAFAIAVMANVAHGLPLTTADRRAAAIRLLISHPDRSDRILAKHSGLSAKTISTLRAQMTADLPQSDRRLGSDGKLRPVDATLGRTRAAELLRENPTASLREVSRACGISPATVRDVRVRLEQGDDPVPIRTPRSPGMADGLFDTENVRTLPSVNLLDSLRRDPSLRQTDAGRTLLRLLSWQELEPDVRERLLLSVPPHCRGMVARAARECAVSWQIFATKLVENHDAAIA
ncbi:ParB N-terminal domain-containing protein [Nocardia heshunensis]